MKSRLFRQVIAALAVAASVGLLFGCSDDDDDGGGGGCDAAIEKLKSCGYSTDGQVTCDTDADKCAADCVMNNSCEEIDEAYTAGTGPFVECVNACQ